jgi:hypothetical protein
MVSLDDLGLLKGTPAEVVLSTFGPEGTPHASAMGVRVQTGSKVFLKVFTDTVTFRNLATSRAAVVNIVGDVELLVRLALKGLLESGGLRFKKSRCVNAPRLKEADAFVEVEVKSLRREQVVDELGASEVVHVETEVKCIEVGKPGIHPFRRSESFVVESAILATRAMEAAKRGREEIARKIFQELSSIQARCERMAPGTKDLRLITEIAEALRRRFNWLG